MTTTRPVWHWCLLGAVAMSLGWGLRGSIGGGSLGAMIPGAMIGLVLCYLLDRHADAGLIAAFAAIGVGFGGQETYGQTVGLSLVPETFWWAILGFVIKGAAWGLLGGAFIGIALDRPRHTNAQILAGFAIMVLGTWLGWQYLDDPKLIYFSNRFDRPREEVWAGLWLGGLLLLAWLRSRVPSLFALYGTIGGGIGFGVGASLQPLGKAAWAGMPLGWWKAMELTFGAILGLAYVACAWRLRHELAGDGSTAAAGHPLPRALLAAILAIGLVIVAGQYVPVRFDYTIVGAVLASLVLFSESLAWQTAITATVAAFGVGLPRLPDLRSRPARLDHHRRHDRRCRGRRRSSSEDASDAPPADLGRRGQRLQVSPAALQSGTRGGDDAHGLRCPRVDPERHAPWCVGSPSPDMNAFTFSMARFNERPRR